MNALKAIAAKCLVPFLHLVKTNRQPLPLVCCVLQAQVQSSFLCAITTGHYLHDCLITLHQLVNVSYIFALLSRDASTRVFAWKVAVRLSKLLESS